MEETQHSAKEVQLFCIVYNFQGAQACQWKATISCKTGKPSSCKTGFQPQKLPSEMWKEVTLPLGFLAGLRTGVTDRATEEMCLRKSWMNQAADKRACRMSGQQQRQQPMVSQMLHKHKLYCCDLVKEWVVWFIIP